MTQSDLNHWDVPCRAPSFCDQGLSADVIIEEIKRLVNKLLFAHNILPFHETVANRIELHAPVMACLVQCSSQVFQTGVHIAQGLRALVAVRVDGVKSRAHRFGHFTDLRK